MFDRPLIPRIARTIALPIGVAPVTGQEPIGRSGHPHCGRVLDGRLLDGCCNGRWTTRWMALWLGGFAIGISLPCSAADLVLHECRVKLIDQVTLACDRSGVLAEMAFREGDLVSVRQRIARIKDDVPAAQLTVHQAKSEYTAEVSARERAYLIAENEHRQALDANRETPRTVPLLEVERLRLAKELADFEIAKARHELRLSQLEKIQAEAELAAYSVTAPISGSITKVFKKRGEAVRQGDPIVELTSTDRVRVDGWLDLKDAFFVTQGMPVRVQLELPDVELAIEEKVFEGKVTFVDVVVEPVSRQVRISADVVNQDNLLRAGLTARMSIAPPSGRTAATRPLSTGRDNTPPLTTPPTVSRLAPVAAPPVGERRP